MCFYLSLAEILSLPASEKSETILFEAHFNSRREMGMVASVVNYCLTSLVRQKGCNCLVFIYKERPCENFTFTYAVARFLVKRRDFVFNNSLLTNIVFWGVFLGQMSGSLLQNISI